MARARLAPFPGSTCGVASSPAAGRSVWPWPAALAGSLGPASLGAPMPTSVNRPAHQRYSQPRPAPARALAAIAIAACSDSGPAGRSCAYGGRENPIAVSQPIRASGRAEIGSATNDTTPATHRAGDQHAGGRQPAAQGGRDRAHGEQQRETQRQRERCREPASVLAECHRTASRPPIRAKSADLDTSLTPRSRLLTRC